MDEVKAYIIEKWKETLRFHTEDEGSRIGLPYPYTVPTANEVFDELYYWDTYFTNKGLLLSGMGEQAKNNCENIAYLIERFGYMPNGSRYYYLGRSQPPFFALMVEDIYEEFPDDAWLKRMVGVIKKELKFWYTRRATVSGLQRYGVENDDEWCKRFFKDVWHRIDQDKHSDPVYAGRCYGGEAESGWDFTARFEGECVQFNPVDLNSLLYIAESLVVKYSKALSLVGWEKYDQLAKKREALINELCFDEARRIYQDYRFDEKRGGMVASTAGFMPYVAGVVEENRRMSAIKLLKILELEYGVSAAEEVRHKFQWGYPNAWAPAQQLAVAALAKYGFLEDAKRIAKKYVELVRRNFEKTGGLWEKYNAKTGDIDAVSENAMPQMLGWTAGTYLYCLYFLENML